MKRKILKYYFLSIVVATMTFIMLISIGIWFNIINNMSSLVLISSSLVITGFSLIINSLLFLALKKETFYLSPIIVWILFGGWFLLYMTINPEDYPHSNYAIVGTSLISIIYIYGTWRKLKLNS